MAVSKVNAEEYTQALAQHMVASWRQIQLADSMGIPGALGYDNLKDWVTDRLGGYMRLSIQQRQEALKELEAQGYTREHIAEITGLSATTQKEAHRKGGGSAGSNGREQGESGGVGGGSVGLIAQIEELEAEAKARKAEQRKETKALKDRIAKLNASLTDVQKQLAKEQKRGLDPQEESRLQKEAEARIEETREEIARGLGFLLVQAVSNALGEAADGVARIIETTGGITSEQLAEIETANAKFIEELNVARMAEIS